MEDETFLRLEKLRKEYEDDLMQVESTILEMRKKLIVLRRRQRALTFKLEKTKERLCR